MTSLKAFTRNQSVEVGPAREVNLGCEAAGHARRRGSTAGFTLIELIIVIGVFVLLVGLSLLIDLNGYRGGALRAERSALITVLQTARADALNNINQRAHGVAIHPADHPDSYVTFTGTSYASSDPATQEVIGAHYPAIIATSSPAEIIFCQLSGDAAQSTSVPASCDDPDNAYDGQITMTDPARGLQFTITINHEGAISW